LKNISLLPVELKNYQTSAKRINKYTILIAFLILGFVLVYAVLSLAVVLPQQQLAAIKQERQEVQKKIAELQPYEDMKNTSEAAKKLVVEAMGTNPEWDNLFVNIFNSIPDGIWLNDFSSSYQANTGEISIRGWAKTHTDVADWLSGLKNMDDLNNVQCQFAEKSGSDGGSGNVQFEIKAALAQGSPYELPAEGGAEK
jgi:Tfp pilus assembly protein PilN